MPRPIITPIGPSIAYVPVTQGLYALIEVEDVHLVEKFNWCLSKSSADVNCYALRNLPRPAGVLSMHRHLMGVPPEDVDHKNGNGLDNRRLGNLRKASASQNIYNSRKSKSNTSGYKGVSRSKRGSNLWRAYIVVKGKQMTLGNFSDVELAADAYRIAAIQHAGAFARC